MPNLLEEKDAIRETIARYCFFIDGAKFDDWAELFTADGRFEVPGLMSFEGKEKIRAFGKMIPLDDRGLPGFKHCTLNHVISVDGDRASAQCYLILVRSGAGAIHLEVAGRYDDELVKENGRWLFRRRTVHFDYRSTPA